MNHSIESLPILILDVYGRCNCRCVMCDIWERTAAAQFATEDLIRQLPAMERLGVQWVVLTGGEPLMNPGLFRLCGFLKDRRIRVTLLTTGMLLERYAQEIVGHIDDLIVSLDGPCEIHNRIRRVAGAFETMSAGIHAIRTRAPRFPISARSTVQRANCAHLSAAVDAARLLACDSISFLAVDTHSTAFNHRHEAAPHPARLTVPDIDVLAREVERLIASGECGRFIVESPAKLRRIVDQARWALGLGEPVAPPCNAPWVSAVVDSEGVVRPCFFHAPIGTIGAELSLDAVLNSPKAIAFRASLDIPRNPVCRRCVCSLNRNPV